MNSKQDYTKLMKKREMKETELRWATSQLSILDLVGPW
jgi:hypothetical protein